MKLNSAKLNTRRNWLFKLREQKQLSQLELARRLGITHQVVSSWESGKQSPSRDLTFRLADLLGADVLEMFAAEARTKNQQEEVA